MWAYKGEMQYNFAFCIGQSCDGAVAMASERSGVTSIVQNKSPLAYYIYCRLPSAKKTALLKSCIKEL